MKPVTSGGGWHAIRYTIELARRVGPLKLWRAMRSRNACKTCALGMGGQKGGMRNEAGHFPEVCKKSLQAMVADMQGGINPKIFQQNTIAQLRSLSPKEAEHLGRLTVPLYAEEGSNHYRPVSWEQAMAICAKAMTATSPDRSFFYASGRSSNEAAFLLQLFARLYGTNNVNNCSYYCHQASGVGLTHAFGSGTATVTFDDIENADLFFLMGGNPASNHPRLLTSLMKLRRNGGRVVVINPVKEMGLVKFRIPSDLRSLLFGTRIADDYVQINIGSDLALLMGIAKYTLLYSQHHEGFVAEYTEGFDDFVRACDDTSWDEICEQTGLSREHIEELAEIYGRSSHTIFSWTMGITHHIHGSDNVKMIANLALLRGMVGKPHAGLLPIRGHSNIQGVGSVGVTPALKSAVLTALEQQYAVKLPTSEGKDSMACMDAAHNGEMDLAFCLGGNLYGANPDSNYAREALNKVKTLVYCSTTLNQGHFHGTGRATLVLPVLARDEEQQATTQESMFNYIRLSDGGKPRHDGPRSEVAVIAELAHAVLGPSSPISWDQLKIHDHIRTVIGSVIPGFAKLAEINKTKEEFQINGRTFHTPHFATPNGKARFSACRLPSLKRQPGELALMTVRSEGQFNTVVYEEDDLYRGQERRDVILMNRSDILELGLHSNQRVTVTSSAGKISGVLVRPYDIKAGNALMYYPEANVLVPTSRDPESLTPAFKNIAVTISQ